MGTDLQLHLVRTGWRHTFKTPNYRLTVYTHGSILLSEISLTQKDNTSCIDSLSGCCEQICGKHYLKTRKDMFGLQFEEMWLIVVRETMKAGSMRQWSPYVHSQKARHRKRGQHIKPQSTPSPPPPWPISSWNVPISTGFATLPNSTVRCYPTNLESISHWNHSSLIFSPPWNTFRCVRTVREKEERQCLK